MAETSGFQTDLPQSAYLSLSIDRAISLAQQRSHRYVTLEHLLFTLLDDPNTTEILEGLRADISGIRGNITETVNRGLTSLYTPGEFDLHASYKVERVLQTASDDADRLNCDDVDAAFVIAALSRESDNYATEILKRNGVTYSSAVSWLYANRGATTPTPRTQSRSAPAWEEEAGAPPVQVPSSAPRQNSAPIGPMRAPPAAAPARERYSSAPGTADARSTQVSTDNATVSVPVLQDLDYDDEPIVELAEEELLEVEYEADEDRAAYANEYQLEQADIADAGQVPPGNGPIQQGAASRRKAVNGRSRDIGSEIRSAPSQNAPSGPPPIGPMPRGAVSGQSANGGYSGYRGVDHAPAPPLPSPSRPEPVQENPVPSISRLDEMRLGKGRSAPVGAPPAGKSKKGAKKKDLRSRSAKTKGQKARVPATAAGAQAKRSRRPLRPHEVLAGRIVENIPRKMRAAVADRIEVRISREETQALIRGMEGRGEVAGHDISITSTMSVALRAPDGGFTIEPLSPETQWIFNRPDEADIYGRWRWVVTPHKTGERRLQLLIASRSVGPSGIVGDTALPDQVITIRVRTNYWLTLLRGIQWLTAMVVGGIITELALVGTGIFGL